MAMLLVIGPAFEADMLLQQYGVRGGPEDTEPATFCTGSDDALARRCRIGSAPVLKRHVSAWNKGRNRSGGTARWQFTTDEARVKLHRLYPQIQG
jgi:hypothetical protein